MNRVYRIGPGVLCVLAASFWGASVRAGADSPEDVLKSNGLKQSGPVYILETEADAKKKLNEVKEIARQLQYARLQQQAFGTPQEREAFLQNMTAQINQLRAESNAVGQQMNRFPRFGGRRARYFYQSQRNQMQAYRNQLNAEINQQNAFLKQVKSRPFDTNTKDKLDAEAKSLADEYQHAVRDLNELVRTTHEKYRELAKDDGVKKALEALQLKIRPSPKLGPSHEFREILKTAEKLEREAPPDPFSDPAPAAKNSSRRARSAR